ncbi:MAG: hypothetical protein FJX72_07095 [Armatimonadetes bacterium]|nr:hypothetical protein [Armatimonadota bacterium]
MELFWETRRLTQAREDHLTCFLAAALEVDPDFRRAYGHRVLDPISTHGVTPAIAAVATQVEFPAERCRPDMLLTLEDGRRIICEHKLDAPETSAPTEDGERLGQLERYLELPGIAFVAYFRTSSAPLAREVLDHGRYLRPADAAHFVWRDLYTALEAGSHDITRWLRRGFDRLGFTPPNPHVGELWPDDTEAVKRNQANFGKLWDAARGSLEAAYRITVGRRCELYFSPLGPSSVASAHASPLAQGGTLLRCRFEPSSGRADSVFRSLEAAARSLPVSPEIVATKAANGAPAIDLLVSLREVLGTAGDPAQQATRLKLQVVPLLEAMAPDAPSAPADAREP